MNRRRVLSAILAWGWQQALQPLRNANRIDSLWAPVSSNKNPPVHSAWCMHDSDIYDRRLWLKLDSGSWLTY